MNIGSQYNDKKLYRGIKHADGLPLTSEDLHEYADTQVKKNDYLLSSILGSGVIKEPSYDTSIKTTIKEEYTTPKEASIYRMDAIKLVEQDKIDHPDVDIENTSSMEEEITKGPVKKLVNNPWASAEGIKTVSPGELNLK